MVVDPVGLAVGIGGLLLAFKGAVDSYVYFDAIVERDNGSRYLALKYFVEKHKLTVWGDKFKLHDAENSPLRDETKETRLLVAGILAEISATHDAARKFLDRYTMEAPQDVSGTDRMIDLTAMVTEQRREKRQDKRFLWASKDKAKFTDLVARLKELNDDLYSIVRAQERDALNTALTSYLLPHVTNDASLCTLQMDEFRGNEVLALSAGLKELNQKPESDLARRASWLRYADLTLDSIPAKAAPNQLQSQRTTGYYHPEGELERRVWVEWKVIGDQLSSKEKSQIRQRIEALGTLMSSPRAQKLRIPRCTGILEDQAFGTQVKAQQQRIGFVYQIPSQDFDALAAPQTLSELIENTRAFPPTLGDRIKLAYELATAFSLLHASKWLHKGFRSNNVLFFRSKNQTSQWKTSIQYPYITGFEYSRPESENSIESRPTGNPYTDLYYHPDALHGFTRMKDIYSLGVVLFEIALWRPLRERFPKSDPGPLERMSPVQIRDFLLASVEVLAFQAGTLYRDVVSRCLTGDFGVDEDVSGVEISRAFFSKVILELASCKV